MYDYNQAEKILERVNCMQKDMEVNVDFALQGCFKVVMSEVVELVLLPATTPRDKK